VGVIAQLAVSTLAVAFGVLGVGKGDNDSVGEGVGEGAAEGENGPK
jgi:hypothetical protein